MENLLIKFRSLFAKTHEKGEVAMEKGTNVGADRIYVPEPVRGRYPEKFTSVAGSGKSDFFNSDHFKKEYSKMLSKLLSKKLCSTPATMWAADFPCSAQVLRDKVSRDYEAYKAASGNLSSLQQSGGFRSRAACALAAMPGAGFATCYKIT